MRHSRIVFKLFHLLYKVINTPLRIPTGPLLHLGGPQLEACLCLSGRRRSWVSSDSRTSLGAGRALGQPVPASRGHQGEGRPEAQGQSREPARASGPPAARLCESCLWTLDLQHALAFQGKLSETRAFPLVTLEKRNQPGGK